MSPRASFVFRRQRKTMSSHSSRSTRSRFSLVLALISILTIGLIPYRGRAGSPARSSVPAAKSFQTLEDSIHATERPGGFVLQEIDGAATCRDATPEEAVELNQRAPEEALHVITPIDGFHPQAAGLQITLRATAQLESFPDAKAAFLRAAATWQGIIQTPISIVIDVDFGPMRFGKPYPLNVLGSTDSQLAGGSTVYPNVRTALIPSAVNPQETSLYSSLPSASVPTDLGST